VAVSAGLSTLVSVVTSAGLAPTFSSVSAKGAFTLLAPTNAAFTALSAANANLYSWVTASKNVASLVTVLQYHAAAGAVFSRSLTNNQAIPMLNAQTVKVGIAGSVVTFSDNQATPTVATVTSADNAAYNGVAHVIDKVLLPTGLPWASLPDAVAVASANQQLSSLVSALTAANLVTALQAPAGPFTILAPVSGAFVGLSDKYSATTLTSILKLHVIIGRFYAADLQNGTVLSTLNGETLTVSINGAVVKFVSSSGSSTTVITADVDSSNAAIHIVDTVVLPSGISPVPSKSGSASIAVSLASALVAVVAVALSL